MHYLNLFLAIFFLLLFSNCKKKSCDGTNTISGRIVNGTTMQGIKGVPLEISIWDVDENLRAKNINKIGTVITDDTGYFSIEYPCQVKHYQEIAIDPLPPYLGFMHARESYVRNFNKTYYFSTKGSAQLVLKPLKPLGLDTLFVGYNEAGNWIYQDSFINSVPYFWKKVYGKNGGGRGVFWARSKSKYLNAYYNGKRGIDWDYVNISGDPIVDSVFVKY
jgi:hypothetical protein